METPAVDGGNLGRQRTGAHGGFDGVPHADDGGGVKDTLMRRGPGPLHLVKRANIARLSQGKSTLEATAALATGGLCVAFSNFW